MLSAAEIASMQATVAASFDVTVTVQTQAAGKDVYGHNNGAFSTLGTAKINVISPTDSQLQLYAGLIGSQRALLIRYQSPPPAGSVDINEGNQIVYQSRNWLVHKILSAESYTFCNDALIVTIA